MFERLTVFVSRVSGFLGRGPIQQEFDEEIDQHLDMLTEENMRRGMTGEEARLAARRSFGGIAQVKETQRELSGLPQIDMLAADLRYACRMLRRNPGFTLVSVLTLALGIGVNTTLFTAYNAVALKPLPVADPSTVVRFERWFERNAAGNVQYAFSFPEFEYFRDHSAVFKSVIAASWPVPVWSDFEKLHGQMVSGNYFAALGISATLGRTFLAEEDGAPAAHPAIVLSHNLWNRRFHRDSLILGQTLKLNGTAFTIIGVAPEEFPGTAVPPQVPDFWAPVAMQPQLAPGRDWRSDPDNRQFVILGRLAPYTTLKRAQAETAVLMRQFTNNHVERDKTRTLTLQRVTYFGNTEDTRFQALVAALMLLVGLVLLIACANLANMLLARAATRQREIAVRLSLGASRGRIIRQLLTESTLLSLLGGAVGLLFSTWSAKLLWLEIGQMLFGPLNGITVGMPLTPDVRVFGYTLLLALLTGLIFGLSPAVQFSKPDLTTALKQEGMTSGRRLSRSHVRSLLVAGQVAASMLLLIIAGLLMRGLMRSQDAQPGFEARSVYMVTADFGNNPVQAARLQQRLYSRAATAPELHSVALGGYPMIGTWTPAILVDGAR